MDYSNNSAATNEPPYRVLIVDDDQSQRDLQKEILNESCFVSVEAENGEQAIEIIKSEKIDVVLLDKSLPGINGDETCRRIRQELNLKLLPIIMVTGHNDYQHIISSMQSGANDFIRKPFNILELRSRVKNFASNKRLTDNLDNAENILFSVARMVEARDKNTHNHCERVSYMADAFARHLKLNLHDIRTLRRAGILHDIGKIAVPDSVLLKQGKLDKAEWDCMCQHPVVGENLLADLTSMADVLPIVRHHHERWNGSGYPDGLIGEEIPFLARVFQLIDIYDALANERSYKEPFTIEKIIQILEDEAANGLLDPDLCWIFVDILKNEPELIEVP